MGFVVIFNNVKCCKSSVKTTSNFKLVYFWNRHKKQSCTLETLLAPKTLKPLFIKVLLINVLLINIYR